MGLLKYVDGAQEKMLRPTGGCRNCPRKRVDLVQATLLNGKVLWLGDVPGETDVAEQEGFTGASGELLRKAAREFRVPEPWSFSNIVHCRPPNGAAPTDKEVSCCLSQYTLEEIRGYPFVVLCGNVPLSALFPEAKASHYRGNVLWHADFPEQRFYPIYHPSYVLRRRDLMGEFRQQIERLARIVREPNAAEGNFELVEGAAAVALLDEWMKAPMWSMDYETTGLHSWAAGEQLKTLSVTADGKRAVVASREEPFFEAMLQKMGQYVAQPGKSVIGHHVGFDLEWLERATGVRARCQLIYETGAMWYHAGQYQQSSLKELTARELDGYRYLIHHPHREKNSGRLRRYNAEDVIHQWHLQRKALKQLPPKTRDLVARVLGPVDVVLQRMTAKGIYLRQDYRQAKIKEYQERRREVVAKWRAEDKSFIPDTHESGDGLLHYLFTIRKLPVLEETTGGDPSTDKSVLKQLVRDGHSIVQHLLDLRSIDTITNTFLTAYDKHVWADSRVRSRYTLTRTDTGRSSSTAPNLQNIPRKKEIRDLFGVPPGSVMMESDLSQIEFRIMVCLAQDENGIAGYLRGEDAHTMTARKVSGKEHPTSEDRTNSKPINFGFLYGAQAPTVQAIVADDYGVVWTDRQAEQFREMFMATYPRIPQFHARSRAKLLERKGWFESAVGHIYHYDEWDSPKKSKQDHIFRAALNSEGQGPAAHIAFYIMVLARRLLDERGFNTVEFVNTVHDSILTEVPNPAWVKDVAAILDEATEMAHQWVREWFVVPLILEHKSGESWGSMTKVK